MSFLGWFRSLLSQRGKALASYKSGMGKANKGDYAAAIADYSAVIDSSEAPKDLQAMAIYNRALAYSATQQHAEAVADLDTVLKMPHLSQEIKTAAVRRKERLRKRAEREKHE